MAFSYYVFVQERQIEQYSEVIQYKHTLITIVRAHAYVYRCELSIFDSYT